MNVEDFLVRMNVLYKENEYEICDLIEAIEIKTKFFRWLTLKSLIDYMNKNNLRYYMIAEGDNCILKITKN